jgi:XRE family transcriptional regulator, fatty acid utilization regulator
VPRRPDRPHPAAKAFGKAVRKAREERGETLDALAHRIEGMDPSYLGELEGGWHDPRVSTVKRIADALGKPVSELMRDV